MSVDMWRRFLHDSSPPDHAVQVYRDVGELADSVAAYVAAGFDAGEPAVVIGTAEHWRACADRLGEKGWPTERVKRHGLLFFAHADATLQAIMDGGRPSRKRFEEVVGGLIDRVSLRFPGRKIRAFGEMVDLLCERGNPEAAAALEEIWNWFGQHRRFSLLCGYRLDLFDREAQVSVLPDVCRAHSHVHPAEDTARLQRAVEGALEETLGPADAGKVYVLVAEQMREQRIPAAQLALMWVSAQTPKLADRILASARTRYLQEPLRS